VTPHSSETGFPRRVDHCFNFQPIAKSSQTDITILQLVIRTQPPCWCTKDYDWQATASHECSCTYHLKHPEIRQRSDAASTWRSTLVGWMSLIASRSDCASTSFCAYAAWRYRTCPNCDGLFRSLKDVRRHLRSSGLSQLVVPRYSLATVGRRVFGYAGPKAWNSLPDYLRCGDLSLETLKRQLKTFLFANY